MSIPNQLAIDPWSLMLSWETLKQAQYSLFQSNPAKLDIQVSLCILGVPRNIFVVLVP